jgi:hypothetical protein
MNYPDTEPPNLGCGPPAMIVSFILWSVIIGLIYYFTR